MNRKLARARTVFAVGRHREPPDAFLRVLSAREGLGVGRWGRRFWGRRWLNLVTTPMRFRAAGGWVWRVQMATGMVLTGGMSQLLVDVVSKGIAVGRLDGRAGLDVLPTVGDDRPCWTIVRFWAWPTGHGFGRELIGDVVAAADASGSVLQLQAGNRQLADAFYARLGFAIEPGQESARHPWIERVPMRAETESEAAVLAGVAR
jgi:hypothetical protein